MREIGEAADLSPANLYYYFRGKDELLFFCQDQALTRMVAAVEAARRETSDPVARLVRVFEAHARTMLDDVDGGIAHLQIDALTAPHRRTIVGKRDRYERAVRRLLEEGVAQGALAVADPAIETRAMLGALNWTVTWFRPDGGQSATVVGRTIADFLVRGVRTPQQLGRQPGSSRARRAS